MSRRFHSGAGFCLSVSLIAFANQAIGVAQRPCTIDANNATASGCGGRGSTDRGSAPVPAGGTADTADRDRENARSTQRAWYLQEGIDYFDRGDWDNAIASFEDALQRRPNDEEIQSWIARSRTAKAASSRRGLAIAPSGDASVVDTRGVVKVGADMLARVPELAKSPEAERVRKGYQAVS